MIVGLIRTAIDDLWTERFPQNHDVDFPKGLVKELSEIWQPEDDMTDREYERRVEIQWFDQDTDNFEAKKETIITAMLGLTSNSEVDRVQYLGSQVGYSPIEDRMVLSMEFLIEHRI